jgi:hypothetical protein
MSTEPIQLHNAVVLEPVVKVNFVAEIDFSRADKANRMSLDLAPKCAFQAFRQKPGVFPQPV